jgi:hypothetical protein
MLAEVLPLFQYTLHVFQKDDATRYIGLTLVIRVGCSLCNPMGRSTVERKFGGKYVECPESKNTNAITCLKMFISKIV